IRRGFSVFFGFERGSLSEARGHRHCDKTTGATREHHLTLYRQRSLHTGKGRFPNATRSPAPATISAARFAAPSPASIQIAGAVPLCPLKRPRFPWLALALM